MTPELDVLIIGGRAAGASLALLLAQQGRSVLMVDRDSFPSDTLSTHFMSPLGVAHLSTLGVLDQVLAAGFKRVTRARTWVGDCHFEGPMGPFGSFGLTPRRDVLDSILIEAAVRAGAQFLERTRAESLIVEDGSVLGAVLAPAGAEPREVRARLTVGADGKFSKVAEWVGAHKYHEVPALRPAYYAYFHGVEPLPEPAVELYFGGDQIGFLFPMRPGEDCIAVEFQPEEFEAFRGDVRGNFMARVSALPGLKPRLANAEIEDGRVAGTRGVDNFFRKPYGDGWALTGDAAYLKDPSTGLGLGDALHASILLAPALAAWFEGAGWEETMSAYQERRDAAMMPGFQATLAQTRMADPDPQTTAWIRAAFGNIGAARLLAAALPAIAATALPPSLTEGLRQMAALYAREAEGAASR